MAEELTIQQREAVKNRGGELLVSAAAGSGKTKVLVDRLISYLTDPSDPANLDAFLIITFTKAAAAELRGKIAAKLTERIGLEPDNKHLQQQIQRLYLTNISTVHSFCAELLREYAYRLDLPADFRVAEEDEAVEMQQLVIGQLLEHAYEAESPDPDFFALIDSQGFGRDDRNVTDVILKVFKEARCHLDPERWLSRCEEIADTSGVTDASQTVWGAYLIEDLHNCLDGHIPAILHCAELAGNGDRMEKAEALLLDTVAQLRNLRNCMSWNEIYMNREVDFGSISFPRKNADKDLIERIKLIRDACISSVRSKLRNFSENSDRALACIDESAASVRALVRLVRAFSAEYDRYKKSRRVLDFSDLEHKTLDLLLGKERQSRTYLADEIAGRFREVMVDEYQDSNDVQDAIYRALTEQRHNCFMVGDVKQSIYSFRQADPGIFLEKYNQYLPAENAVPGRGRKVILSDNFRSAASVIEAVNSVFEACMSKRVGGLDYGEDEALHEGIVHTPVNEPEVELYGIQVDNTTYADEANFVAKRIMELLDGTHLVREKDALRPIVPEDIVILLRAPSTSGPPLMKALSEKGIRVSMGGGVDLLHTEEVGVLRSLLQVIDNPQQDIPLLAVLASRIFCFTSDELAAIRSADRYCSIYDCLKKSDNQKASDFLALLRELRKESRLNPVTALVSSVLSRTRIDSIYSAMPDGDQRMENLQSFCKIAAGQEANGAGSLDQFLFYLDALEKEGILVGSDTREAGAVTIMSIHKSKGLEFPVVFLCGMARSFNTDSSRSQVLCDKELGLGLACVNNRNRVRFPTIAKRAIAAKIAMADRAEEMRVLYVAMTRAKDRLIMTYASKNLQKDLYQMVEYMGIYDRQMLTADATCPGDWLLMVALSRQEADQFFALSGRPGVVHASDSPWHIQVIQPGNDSALCCEEVRSCEQKLPSDILDGIRSGLDFRYPFPGATQAPSKQTATQLKGRHKDQEAAEGSAQQMRHRRWRVPSFVEKTLTGTDYGTAFHKVMQHIRFDTCTDQASVEAEIQRLVQDGLISAECGNMVDARQITAFFESDIGMLLRAGKDVLREFKFSVLDDAVKYGDGLEGERVLLQGVVDCAVIEDDGLTIIDFKTDRVTESTLAEVAAGYQPQISAYSSAMSRICEKPVKTAVLYFVKLNKFVAF